LAEEIERNVRIVFESFGQCPARFGNEVLRLGAGLPGLGFSAMATIPTESSSILAWQLFIHRRRAVLAMHNLGNNPQEQLEGCGEKVMSRANAHLYML
jgi:hypothetical protein